MTKCCPFHNRCGPIQSSCHEVVGWTPQGMVPYGGSVLISDAGILSTQQWPLTGQWKVMLLSHLVLKPIGWWQVWLKKEAVNHWKGHPILLLTFFFAGHPLVSIHWRNKYVQKIFAHSERPIHLFSPDFGHQISNHIPSTIIPNP